MPPKIITPPPRVTLSDAVKQFSQARATLERDEGYVKNAIWACMKTASLLVQGAAFRHEREVFLPIPGDGEHGHLGGHSMSFLRAVRDAVVLECVIDGIHAVPVHAGPRQGVRLYWEIP